MAMKSYGAFFKTLVIRGATLEHPMALLNRQVQRPTNLWSQFGDFSRQHLPASS
jgi:hypothetical protein